MSNVVHKYDLGSSVTTETKTNTMLDSLEKKLNSSYIDNLLMQNK